MCFLVVLNYTRTIHLISAHLNSKIISNLLAHYQQTILFSFWCAVDCSTASIGGQLSYTRPDPETLGSTMDVTCVSGYQWDVSPFSGVQTAKCTDNMGTGSWSIAGNPSCVCMLFSLRVHRTKLLFAGAGTGLRKIIICICMNWMNAVCCENATIIGNFEFTIPNYAPISSTMSVTCSTGYAWKTAPYQGTSGRTATCTDSAGVGTWTLSDSCVGAMRTDLWIMNNI